MRRAASSYRRKANESDGIGEEDGAGDGANEADGANDGTDDGTVGDGAGDELGLVVREDQSTRHLLNIRKDYRT